jgi:hypothetical protein
MNKLIKVAEVTPTHTTTWECPDYLIDCFAHHKQLWGSKKTLMEFFEYVVRFNKKVPIKLISQVKAENSPKITGLNADFIYSEEI